MRIVTMAAAAAVLPVSGNPWGQSSVTVGGTADAAARWVRNEGLSSVKSLVSGSNSTSRLTIRGQEDLGGGLAAGFHLEHGLLLDAGAASQATQFWDRRSTVSVFWRPTGELRFGRDFVPSYSSWTRFDPFGYVGVAGSNNLISATPIGPIRSAFGSSPNTTVRTNNSIHYFLPSTLGGVEGGLTVAPSEGGIAANGQHKVLGGRLGYVNSRGAISAAHTITQNDVTGNARFKDSVVGANANLEATRVSAAWRRFSHGAAGQTNTMLGVVHPVGPLELKASVVRADFKGRVGNTVIGANTATLMALGAVYNFSKRSAVYASVARIDNKGAAAVVVPGGAAGLLGGRSSTGAELGLRHNF